MTVAAIRARVRSIMLNSFIGVGLCLCAFLSGCGRQEQSAVKDIDGKYYDEDGSPTYKVHWDGTVDWYTFSGYQHFTLTCLVCHGPDAMGSTFAPALTNSFKKRSYADFVATVATGRKNNTMPSFSQNKNVMCHLDAIYIYLRARARHAVDRGKPEKHEPKPAAAAKTEDECFGPSWHRRPVAED
jgi:methanol metabolism-related c-type cytochrome